MHLLYCWTLAEATCIGSTCVGRASCSPPAAKGFTAGFCLAEAPVGREGEWGGLQIHRLTCVCTYTPHTHYLYATLPVDRIAQHEVGQPIDPVYITASVQDAHHHSTQWRHTFSLLPLSYIFAIMPDLLPSMQCPVKEAIP